MKERPILFSADMVRAILQGQKTQTRRVIKPKPTWNMRGYDHGHWSLYIDMEHIKAGPGSRCGTVIGGDKKLTGMWSYLGRFGDGMHRDVYGPIKCPYGMIGNRLWVRETFYAESDEYDCCGSGMHYRADADQNFKWRPAIHMPRGASRITLEIIDIRIEHLVDISAEDALAEGVEPCMEEPSKEINESLRRIGAEQVTKPYPIGYKNYLHREDRRMKYGQPTEPYLIGGSPRDSFKTLWESINGKSKGYTWADNPWVWVVTFKRVSR